MQPSMWSLGICLATLALSNVPVLAQTQPSAAPTVKFIPPQGSNEMGDGNEISIAGVVTEGQITSEVKLKCSKGKIIHFSIAYFNIKDEAVGVDYKLNDVAWQVMNGKRGVAVDPNKAFFTKAKTRVDDKSPKEINVRLAGYTNSVQINLAAIMEINVRTDEDYEFVRPNNRTELPIGMIQPDWNIVRVQTDLSQGQVITRITRSDQNLQRFLQLCSR